MKKITNSQSTMNFKIVSLTCLLAVLTATSCKKSVAPISNNETRVESTSLSSLVPLGDDLDERILIKSRPKLSNGQPAVGASVTVAANNYFSQGVVTQNNDLNFEIPAFGSYSYMVKFNGLTVVNTIINANSQITERTDIVN